MVIMVIMVTNQIHQITYLAYCAVPGGKDDPGVPVHLHSRGIPFLYNRKIRSVVLGGK